MHLELRGTLRAVVVVGVSMASFGAAADSQLRIGAGSVAGIYNQIGASICRFLKKNPEEHGLRCQTKATKGSVSNVRKLREGDLELAVVQSDVQFHAYKGTAEFSEDGPNTELRALFSVVPETFTIVAAKNSNITSVEDLIDGQRVNVGLPGSGGRIVFDALMQHMGWTLGEFREAAEIRTSLQAERICAGQIDAGVLVVAHPNLSLQDTVASCEAYLVPVAGPKIDSFVAERPEFVPLSIAGGLYPSNPEPVPSFGVIATVVTTSAMAPETVYKVVKTVFENLEKFKTLLPVFSDLDRSFMLGDHHAAPWHPGALRYFRETGMM